MGIWNATQSSQANIFAPPAAEKDEAVDKNGIDPISALVQALGKQPKGVESEANKTDPNNAFMDPGLSDVSKLNANEKTAEKKEEIDAAILEIAGGNAALAATIQKLNPSSDVIRALKNGDPTAALSLIEARKAQLKEQMPALNLMEKAIDRDGLDKVVNTNNLTQLVAKFEDQYANQNRIRKGNATEDFLASRGIKAAAADANALAGSDMDGAVDPAALLAGAGAGAAAAGPASALAGAHGKLNALAGNPNPLNLASNGNVVPEQKIAGSIARQAGKNSLVDLDQIGAPGNPKVAGKFKENLLGKDSQGDLAGASADSNTELGAAAAAGVAGGEGAKGQQAGLETLNFADISREGIRNNVVSRMAHNISFVAKQGGGELKMILNPKELGEVQLKVTTNGHRVEVEMIAQNNEVANILRASTKDLADALGSQKLQLAGMEVTVKSGANSSEGGFQQHNFHGGNNAFANLGNSPQQDTRNFNDSSSSSQQGANQERQTPRSVPVPERVDAPQKTTNNKTGSRLVDLQA